MSLTADPDLSQTPLPVPHSDARRVRVDNTTVTERRPRRRLKHWKTKDWKRRSNERKRRAELLANPEGV